MEIDRPFKGFRAGCAAPQRPWAATVLSRHPTGSIPIRLPGRELDVLQVLHLARPDLDALEDGTVSPVGRAAVRVVFHARNQALDAEPARGVHGRLAFKVAALGVGPRAGLAEEFHVGPGFPLLVDDPADHGSPGLELHGDAPRLVTFQ